MLTNDADIRMQLEGEIPVFEPEDQEFAQAPLSQHLSLKGARYGAFFLCAGFCHIEASRSRISAPESSTTGDIAVRMIRIAAAAPSSGTPREAFS